MSVSNLHLWRDPQHYRQPGLGEVKCRSISESEHWQHRGILRRKQVCFANLQEKECSLHAVLWDSISQKCLLETRNSVTISKCCKWNCLRCAKRNILAEEITCITNALWMLIQNASFSSWVNLRGSVSSNREISDLKHNISMSTAHYKVQN